MSQWDGIDEPVQSVPDVGQDVDRDLKTGLSQDARVDRVKGMTTANETALSADDRNDIIQQAREFMSLRGISQAALARMIGHGGSTLGEALKGNYAGDADSILRKIPPAINEYYRSESAPGKGQFVRSRLAERMFTALKYASRFRKMIAIYGPSGVGKTFCARALLAAEFPSGIYLEVNDTCRTPRDIYGALLKMLRVRCSHYSPRNAELAGLIIDRLKDSGRMILIDEADGLRPACFNCLRQLHDATGCPIVLMGRPNLIDRIDGTIHDPKLGASFVRRLVGRFHLDDSADSDGGGTDQWICSTEEMAAMLKRFKVTFSADAARWLCALAHTTAVMGTDQKEAGGLALALDIAEMASVAYKERTIGIAMLEAAMAQIRGRHWAAKTVTLVQEAVRRERRAATA